MTSKEYNNLFGVSNGDDIFSQIQKTDSGSLTNPGENGTTTKSLGDASALFGGTATSANASDFFFQPTTQPQPSKLDAPASSSFEQDTTQFNSSYDEVPKQNQPSLTDAYHPQPHQPSATDAIAQPYDYNAYNSYDYSQQQYQGQEYDMYATNTDNQDISTQQQPEYSNQWQAFDPNVHYYYDEQGQLHYYDPNTNQEYDMSQYGYDQQASDYNYQYDPQYADYYTQQGYDHTNYDASINTTVNNGVYDGTNNGLYDVSATNGVYDASATNGVYDASATNGVYDASATNGVYDASATIGVYDASATNGIYDASATVNKQDYDNTITPTKSYDPQVFSATAGGNEKHEIATLQSDIQYNPTNCEPISNNEGVYYDPSVIPTRDNHISENAIAQMPVQDQSEQIIGTQPLASQDTHNQYHMDAYNQNKKDAFAKVSPEAENENQNYYYMPPINNGSLNPYEVTVSQQEDIKTKESEKATDIQSNNDDTSPTVFNYDETNAPYVSLNEKSSYFTQSYAPQHTQETKTSDNKQREQNIYDMTSAYNGNHDIAEVPLQDEALNDMDNYRPHNVIDSYNIHSYDVMDSSIDDLLTKVERISVTDHTSEVVHPSHSDSNYEQDASASTSFDFSNVSFAGTDKRESISDTYTPMNISNSTSDIDMGGSYRSPPTGTISDNQSMFSQTASTSVSESFVSGPPRSIPGSVASAPPRSISGGTISAPPRSLSNDAVSVSTRSMSHDATSGPPRNFSGGNFSAPPRSVSNDAVSGPPRGISNDAVSGPPRSVSDGLVSAPPRSASNPSINDFKTNYSMKEEYSYQSFSSNTLLANMAEQKSMHRSNNVMTPDRRSSPSPFAYNSKPIERSATVPPPMTERSESPKPALISCPDPQCEGENKPKAKFCCECGRPLAGISRSTTPSANLYNSSFSTLAMDNGYHGKYDELSLDPLNRNMAPPFGSNVLDGKKNALISKLKEYPGTTLFDKYSTIDRKQEEAGKYIRKRIEEFEQQDEDKDKILLWRIVELMINVQMDDETSLNQSIIALLSHSDSAEQMDSGDSDNKSKLDILQDYLVKGDREGCCQFAMENDLWSHAFIISHGTHTDLFQRVARGFIDKQLSSPSEEVVPDIPKNRKMLRMLYAMFSGNESDAVSELVRTSDDDHSSSSIIKDWKEALALILANSTTNSQAVISSLGDALYQQGLVYAPSICYILSPQVSLKPRLESGHAPFSLLSVHGTGIPSDTDVFYLAELYEMSLISKGKQDEAVDVQDYKLVHAWWLSDLGYTDEAQDYCEAISKVIGSSDTPETKLESIKQIGEQDLLGLAASNSLYSLLTKDTFNTLIHSIQGKMTAKSSNDLYSVADNTTHTAEDTSQDMYQPMNGYNYGYQYGQIEHTESGPHQEVTPSKHQTQPSTFPMHKGIQSPFQSNNMAPDSMKPIQSPFGTQPAYGQVPSYAENNSPSWWNSGNKTNDSPAHDSTSYEPYESTNSYEPATSYQPDVYAPPNTSLTNEPNDEDDILGLGNSSRNKKGPETSDDTKKEVEEDKEDPKQDKKETGGGWGIFSLFSRKEKETKEDEKKPVKANLGEESSFYYDEKEKRWVNKKNDVKPVAATPPPPPRSTQPVQSSPLGPPIQSRPNSVPPSIQSAPIPNNTPPMSGSPTAGPPVAGTPSFNTPPTSRRAGGAGGRKPMRSRYVDVLNNQ